MGFPGPAQSGLGMYGNLVEFYKDPIAYMNMLWSNYGEYAAIAANNSKLLFFFGADANKALLMNPEAFSLAGTKGQPGLENIQKMHDLNISHMTGERHKQQRKILRQALNQIDKHQRQLIMNQVMTLLVEQVRHRPDFELCSAIKRLLFYMDWLLIFSSNQDFPPLQELLIDLTELTGEVSFYNMKPQALQQLNQKLGFLEQAFDVFLKQIPPTGEDFFSKLSTTGDYLSKDQVLGHLYALYTASHDTTSSAIITTFILLLLHPEVMKKVMQEIQNVLGKSPPAYEQLEQLTYLEMVIKESLRILPASSILARFCQKDFNYKDVVIPQGATCFLSQYITHRNPEVFEQPLRFIPERWQQNEPGRYDYIPFGTGFHRCIGAESAMAKIKTILSLFFQEFSLSLAPHSVLHYQLKVTLYPKQDVMVKANSAVTPLKKPVNLSGNILEMIEYQP